MSEKRAIGLEYIKVGAVAGDGGMGTVLAALGVTYQDSAELSQADPELTEIFAEENIEPEEVIETPGIKTLKWSIMDYAPATLVKVLGGTVTGVAPNEMWNAPTTNVNIEQSVEFKEKKNGMIVQIPRAKIIAKLNYKISKKGVALVEITAKILTPSKAGVAPIIIGVPAA